MNVWLAVLTSAAVGALVSSAISVWGQYLERSARRKELLLANALEMAKRRSDRLIQAAHAGGGAVKLYDEVIMAEIYYGWLKSLIESGQLPPSAKKTPSYIHMTEEMNKSATGLE